MRVYSFFYNSSGDEVYYTSEREARTEARNEAVLRAILTGKLPQREAYFCYEIDGTLARKKLLLAALTGSGFATSVEERVVEVKRLTKRDRSAWSGWLEEVDLPEEEE